MFYTLKVPQGWPKTRDWQGASYVSIISEIKVCINRPTKFFLRNGGNNSHFHYPSVSLDPNFTVNNLITKYGSWIIKPEQIETQMGNYARIEEERK